MALDPYFTTILDLLDVDTIGPHLVTYGVISSEELYRFITSHVHLSRLEVITRLVRKLNRNVQGFLIALEKTADHDNHRLLLEELKNIMQPQQVSCWRNCMYVIFFCLQQPMSRKRFFSRVITDITDTMAQLVCDTEQDIQY